MVCSGIGFPWGEMLVRVVPSPLRFILAAELCNQPMEEGGCQRYTLRWYYNQRAAECRPFVYSGCQGNLNRFGSQEECELHCEISIKWQHNLPICLLSAFQTRALLGCWFDF
uniref:BPTI/Kunitz inhibitor domain-containing protein n=1 Tax=Meleagris gallopavo TaxID=9103 RepID=A0A803YHB7_MELGA